MKFAVLAAAAFACLTPAVAFAQTAPAPAAPAATATAAKFNLDTPIEVLVANPAAKAVLDADLGMDVTQNPYYDMIKSKSFNETAPMAPDKLPPELLKKIEANLAAIK